MKPVFDLLGRLFLSFIFFYEAYDSIKFFKDTKIQMAEFGLTKSPNLVLSGAIFFLVLGSVLLLLGYRAKFGSTLLLIYLIPVTFIAHSFWTFPIELRLELENP